ncbi:hypothetical protein HF1_01310 [Mycoplasma haemofelis str. Langford 1]|uniref:Uncharacterized protein n=1 Tax=Mycoplasma haemofelis (strain Langford 1) TaxID=941640 RepID=E8ZKH3_MYCHL|nr:hypothetical protein [Mycoplasma haemofelis]CBY92139.1 hypothetical protein HF1_01310 [Mycoplasma haemofelis str. Langford 1]
MFRYFDPKEIIRTYYLEEVVNLNNSSALNVGLFRDRIDNLRALVKKHFSWEGDISFLPSLYHIRQVLLANGRELFLTSLYDPNTSGVEAFACTLHELGIHGLVILGYKEPLTPLFLGSNSISYKGRKEISLNTTPEALECGTQNYPQLFLAERYFHYLVNNWGEVKALVENKGPINFNNLKFNTHG